jgi:hypothetical protein
MEILIVLLFIPFNFAFFRATGFLFRYMLYGEAGASYLKKRDDMKNKKSHLGIVMFLLITLAALFVCAWFISVVIWAVALAGKQGVMEDEIRQYGLFAIIGIPLVFFALASISRHLIRKGIETENLESAEG